MSTPKKNIKAPSALGTNRAGGAYMVIREGALDYRDFPSLAGSERRPYRGAGASGAAVAVLLGSHEDSVGFGVSKRISTAGVEVCSVSLAPGGESIGVDVRLNDESTLTNTTLAELFSLILPLQEASGKLVPIDEHGFQTIVVRFAVPHKADASNLAGD